jgi:hypothetical protein
VTGVVLLAAPLDDPPQAASGINKLAESAAAAAPFNRLLDLEIGVSRRVLGERMQSIGGRLRN